MCPEHNVELKLIPAGISNKTNRPYKAFFACPERGCQAGKVYGANSSTPRPQTSLQPILKGFSEDQKATNTTILRSAIAKSLIESGKTLLQPSGQFNPFLIKEAEEWVKWCQGAPVETKPIVPEEKINLDDIPF